MMELGFFLLLIAFLGMFAAFLLMWRAYIYMRVAFDIRGEIIETLKGRSLRRLIDFPM